MRLLPALAVTLAAASPAAADCATTASDLAQAWLAREPVPAPEIADQNEAVCIQSAMITAIGGTPVGWRVAFGSEAGREAMGVETPMLARLLDTMVLDHAARVDRAFGAEPLAEADLIAVVGSAEIMAAETREQVLESLDSVRPFVAFTDTMLAEGEEASPLAIMALNGGVRAGVAGEPIRVEATDDWEEALGRMTVRIETETGDILADYPGMAAMGHPLDAVLWLVEELAARGETLQVGDLLSIGGFGAPVALPEHGGLRVSYLRLPGDPEATVLALFD